MTKKNYSKISTSLIDEKKEKFFASFFFDKFELNSMYTSLYGEIVKKKTLNVFPST